MTVPALDPWRSRVVPAPRGFRPLAHLWTPDVYHPGDLLSRCGREEVPEEWTRTGILGDRVCERCQRLEAQDAATRALADR